MANQYSKDSFKAVVEAKYNLPIGEVLYQFHKQGKSLSDISKETGFKDYTVRRHAQKHGFYFTNAVDHKSNEYKSATDQLYTELRSGQLNHINVLSMKWSVNS